MLGQLPTRQRAALILCEILHWRSDEAAQVLGTSAAAVASSLQRARAMLARQSDPRDPGLEGAAGYLHPALAAARSLIGMRAASPRDPGRRGAPERPGLHASTEDHPESHGQVGRICGAHRGRSLATIGDQGPLVIAACAPVAVIAGQAGLENMA
jgi:hypothetical protein